MAQQRVKQTYEAGDRVITPLGAGVILSTKILDKPEGQMRCKVAHDHYRDKDGDTFEIDVEQLKHEPRKEIGTPTLARK